MDHDIPIDWRTIQRPDWPCWVQEGTFADAKGAKGVIGSDVELLRSVLTFDERGGQSGTFMSGRVFEVGYISKTEPALLYVEGADGRGWSCAWVDPAEVRLV
jgi:hypothetical protein